MKLATQSKDTEIIGRAKDVCENIDLMLGHTARIANQERYWPEQVEKLKKSMDYTQVFTPAVTLTPTLLKAYPSHQPIMCRCYLKVTIGKSSREL